MKTQILSIACMTIVSTSLQAQSSLEWTGLASPDSSWSNGANWTGGIAPTSDTAASLPSSGGTLDFDSTGMIDSLAGMVNVRGDWTSTSGDLTISSTGVDDINISAGSTFTLSGGNVDLNAASGSTGVDSTGNIRVRNGSAFTVEANSSLTSNSRITINGNVTALATISGTITAGTSGGSRLRFAVGNTLIDSTANISAGNFQVSSGRTVAINHGATLDIDRFSSSGNISIGSTTGDTGTLTFGDDLEVDSITWLFDVNDSASDSVVVNGTLTLDGSSTLITAGSSSGSQVLFSADNIVGANDFIAANPGLGLTFVPAMGGAPAQILIPEPSTSLPLLALIAPWFFARRRKTA